ncbi:MAG: hypothetical protein KAG37_01865 [Flavobacteriales bacterium]|nr:hypothetical protein [Flavobacteriales bacterium]
MKKGLQIIVLIIISSFGINAQNSTYDLGVSFNGSIMKSDYSYVPGTGVKIDNRFSILRTDFTFKNSLGYTMYYNYDITGNTPKEYDHLLMLDLMVEYNFFPMEKQQLGTVTENWTPYIGGGANIIYRADIDSKTFITIKGSLGIKYKLSNNLIFIMEGYLEWDFSDELDGKESGSTPLLKYDHTANFIVGISYRFGGRPKRHDYRN